MSVWKLIAFSSLSLRARLEGLADVQVRKSRPSGHLLQHKDEMASDMDAASNGFYCSTSGTMFESKEEYLAHMKSDFHRYNLKRKVSTIVSN